VGTQVITYKDIRLLVDPVFEQAGVSLSNQNTAATPGTDEWKRTTSPAIGATALPPIDYLLLTDADSHHFGASVGTAINRNVKVLAPAGEAAAVTAAGFSQVRPVGNGQRMLLKKNGAFLFVTALHSKNPGSGREVNGYLLEFDNGRNVFVSGETMDLAALRQFVYSLRDDGREIHLAIVYGGGLVGPNGSLESYDYAMAAEMIGLLQPQVAVAVQADSLAGARMDESVVRAALAREIYGGGFYVAAPGDTIPF
jgi:L-ascorbate metabolism protein UlaG (beta-lactamase superfamily)